MPDRNEYAPGVPSWVDLGTPDAEASKRFYSGIFGWEFEDQGPEAGGYLLATLRGRPVAGVMQTSEQPPAWSSYVNVTDVDRTVALAEKAGGTVVVPPMDVMDAGRMAFVIDTVGAAIGFWQAKNHIGAQIVNEPNAYSWNELVTNDIDKASAFYADVLGWDAQPFEGIDYTVFNNAGEGIAGAVKPPMEGVPTHWMVYFTVADTDATIEQAKRLGATLLADPFDIPEVGRIAPLLDPQGAAFSVIKNANA